MSFSNFVNKYRVDKTLRFSLLPIGETEEHIKNKNLIKEDEDLANNYQDAKKIIDEYHKDFINKSLTKFKFQEKDLKEFERVYNEYRKHKTKNSKNNLKKIQNYLRKQLANGLKDQKHFKDDFLKDILPEWLEENPISLDDVKGDPQEIILKFKSKTTYFQGYYENRKNIYSDKDISTSIGFRLIHENLPKFLNNISDYKRSKKMNIDFSKVERNFKSELNKFTLDELFSLKGFNQCLTQDGIDRYNLIIGGRSEKNTKVQGLNEVINLHSQKPENKEVKKKIRSCHLEELYKQILSDCNETSFCLDTIENNLDLFNQITSVYQIKGGKILTSNGRNLIEKINEVLDMLEKLDSKKVYLKNKDINKISNDLFQDWRTMQKCLEYYAKEKLFPTPEGKKETKKLVKEREKWVKRSYLSFFDIHRALECYFNQYHDSMLKNETSMQKQKEIAINSPLFKYFGKKRLFGIKNNVTKESLFTTIKEQYKLMQPILEKSKASNANKFTDDGVQKIKNYLDSLMEIYHFLKLLEFQGDDTIQYEKDNEFYNKFNELYKMVDGIMLLYNKARNYLTKKQYSVEKYKLNFQCQTLAKGWDVSKEDDNLTVLFLKDEKYFLGIINKENRKIFETSLPNDGDCYQKMEYKLLPNPSQMLMKVFFSNAHIDKYNPSKKIDRIRNHSSHTEGGSPQKGFKKQSFKKDDMHNMIDFLKSSIRKNEDWSVFKFEFSDTKQYENISHFYEEVRQQGYSITFKNISSEYIDKLVKEGKLYLFQIYSKDFSTHSKGRKNLQTLYWQSLFDKENLEKPVYKLNGEAELFYREKSISYTDSIWKKGHHSNDPRKKQKYPIVKDRRYARDTYLFHVPITCNFQADNPKKFNDSVKDYIESNKGIKVIGIDRGERHLAYYTLIDEKGKMLEQGSLNKPLGETDYQKILDQREQDRDKARKSWKKVNKIKDLKQGYLSQVVSKITKLMVEHNAIVVFEDLNFGFKRGRFKIEKQVYQKLEKALIDKLNYLVFKDKEKGKPGSVLKALQLTAPFESFSKMGKQTGFMFYVPAYHTSKICPVTGFANLIYPKYETKEKAQSFFEKFDSIKFNANEDYFEFSFDYKNFQLHAKTQDITKTKWTACSYGSRLENTKDSSAHWSTKEVFLTKEIKDLLNRYSIDFSNGQCLKNSISKQTESKFFKSLIRLLKLTLQIRNSKTGSDEDWIISPIKNNDTFFDSRKVNDNHMPKNADANGAYHIALKGLLLMQQIRKNQKKIDLSNVTWHNFRTKPDKLAS